MQMKCNTNKNDEFALELYHKVRNHCHQTEKLTGALHSICNLSYKTPK